MRILLSTESYLPYVSGVTVSVDTLARGLGARGHEVLVLAPRPARGAAVESVGSQGPEPRHAWLRSYQLPSPGPSGYRVPWPNPFDPAVRQVRRFSPDVVHAHSPFVTGVLARRLARHARRPLVFTHHTRFADYGHYLGPFARPGAYLADAYLRRFWAGCDAIVAPSTELAEEIRSRLPTVHPPIVQVIPTGVDVAGIRGLVPVDVRAVAGWPTDSIIVVSLGRLAPEKSPMIVLEAFAVAAARHPHVRLLLVGGGPLERELRRRGSEPALAGRVHFTGALARPQALAMVAGADLFAFASRTETQGLVLAEALAAGVPALAIDGPGVRDSIRDAIDGCVVASGPAGSRAERLGAVIAELVSDDAARGRLAAAARADAERFAVDRRVEEVEALYGAVSR